MAATQKHIINHLLAGSAIYSHPQGIYLRSDTTFVKKINPRTWRQVKYYTRKGKDGLFVIDKRKVRKEHGNTWIKQEYKKRSLNHSN